MRIVLSGATGFVGRELARHLAHEGHRLVVLSRDPERARQLLGFECELHQWDPETRAAPELAFEGGVDSVIHLAGEPVGARRWSPAVKERIRDSRVIGTRHLVETLNKVFDESDGRPGLVVCASGIGYYGDRDDEVLTDDSPAGEGFLANVCQDWEAEVHRIDGPRCVIPRIGMVLGRGGGALAKMLPAFRLGLGGRLGSGAQWTSWIHLEDLIALFLHVMRTPTLEGAVNAVAPLPISQLDFARALGRALARPTVLNIPASALRLAFGEMSELLTSSQRVLPVKARASGFHFRYERIDRALGQILGQ